MLAAKEPRVKTVIKETPEEKKARGALSLPLPERLVSRSQVKESTLLYLLSHTTPHTTPHINKSR